MLEAFIKDTRPEMSPAEVRQLGDWCKCDAVKYVAAQPHLLHPQLASLRPMMADTVQNLLHIHAIYVVAACCMTAAVLALHPLRAQTCQTDALGR